MESFLMTRHEVQNIKCIQSKMRAIPTLPRLGLALPSPYLAHGLAFHA